MKKIKNKNKIESGVLFFPIQFDLSIEKLL